MPADFNFVLTRTDIDSYSSSDSVYKYEMKFRIDTATTISFTKAEKEKVYGVLVANNFWNIPDNFDDHNCVSDADENSLEVRSGGKTKRVEVYYGCGHDKSKLAQFDNIISVIDSILRSKSAFKGIPRHPLIRA